MADIGLSAFSLFFAKPIVPGAPASSGGGTRALELPDAVRPGPDLQRQSYPGAAGPGQPRPLPSALRRGGDRTGALWSGGGPPAWGRRPKCAEKHVSVLDAILTPALV